MFCYLNRKAQSVAEYVIVLGLVVGAVIAMQIYVKRGLQGRLKNATDYTEGVPLGAQQALFSGEQYEPYYMQSSHFDTTSNAVDNEVVAQEGGNITRNTVERTNRVGDQVVVNQATAN